MLNMRAAAALVVLTLAAAGASPAGGWVLTFDVECGNDPADEWDDYPLEEATFELRQQVLYAWVFVAGGSGDEVVVSGLNPGSYLLTVEAEGHSTFSKRLTCLTAFCALTDLGVVHLRHEGFDYDGDGLPQGEDCDDGDPFWWAADTDGACLLAGDTECAAADRYDRQCNPAVPNVEAKLRDLANFDVKGDKFYWSAYATPGWWEDGHNTGKHIQSVQHFEVDDARFLAVNLADKKETDEANISLVEVGEFGSTDGQLDTVVHQRLFNDHPVSSRYEHPGGMQMIGEYLFVALEDYRNPSNEPSYPTKQNARTGVWWIERRHFDESGNQLPEPPEAEFQWLVDVHKGDELLKKHTAVGVTKLSDGTYLMAACVVKGCEEIRFFKTRRDYLSSGVAPEWKLVGEWRKPETKQWKRGGNQWEECDSQNLNLVVDAVDESIYLVMFSGRKTCIFGHCVCLIGGGKDHLFAYRLSMAGSMEGGHRFDLEFFPRTEEADRKKVRIRTGDTCKAMQGVTGHNFDAGAGLMIHPGDAETLDVVATEHYDSCGDGGYSRWGSTPKWKWQAHPPALSELGIAPENPNEGTEVTASGRVCMQAPLPTFATVDWGDGSEVSHPAVSGGCFRQEDSVQLPQMEHVYSDDGQYRFELCVVQEFLFGPWDEECWDEILDVTNVAPVLHEMTAGELDEGEEAYLAATFSDAGSADTHTAMVNWGDGSSVDVGEVVEDPFGPPGSTSGASGAVTGSHVYADDGPYSVTVTLWDDDHVESEEGDVVVDGRDEGTFVAQVANVAPTADAGEPQVIYEGDVLELEPATFYDPGTLDTHTAEIEWGDGSPTEDGEVVETPYGPPGDTAGLDGEVHGSHQYLVPPGRYTATVTVEDDDGASVSSDLDIAVAHGFLRFCAFAEEKLDVEKDAVVDCAPVRGGTLEETRMSGLASREKLEVKKAAAVLGELLSCEEKVELDKEVLLEGGIRSLGEIKLKQDVQILGDVTSAGDVELERDISVVGDVTAGGEVRMGPACTVDGTVTEFSEVPPIPAITGVSLALAAGGPDVTVEKDETLLLPPGSYGELQVKDRGVLGLESGVYLLEKLEVKKEGQVHFDLSGGVVVIDVTDKLCLKDDVQMAIVSPEGGAEEILFRAGGDVHLHKRGNYLGTYLAPDEDLELSEEATLEGALYGKKVKLGKETHLIGRPALEVFMALFLAP